LEGEKMKRKLPVFIILLVPAIICISISCEKKQVVTSKYPVVTAPTGTYEGQYNDDVSEFLGIRYAAPVEPFKRAQDVNTTTADVIEARNWGASCLQASNEQGGVSRDSCSHDCLYLNIWTRDVATAGKPVIIWIHGGAYMSGSTTNPMYDGEFFVRNLEDGEDCVLVSINYRLSFLGGCDLSVLEGYTDEYADAVNLTKLDQMQALKWVHENIESWGGDANNVTIMGQSSGGGAVFHLMADPDANRYFKRAIEQSGSPMYKVIRRRKPGKIQKGYLKSLA
jgi:para-nitrobenzyl esterase